MAALQTTRIPNHSPGEGQSHKLACEAPSVARRIDTCECSAYHVRYAINLVAGRRTRDRFSTLDTWKHADYRLSDRVQYLSLYVRHLSGRVCSQLSDNRAWIAVLSTGSRSCRLELMYLRVAVATACEVSHRLRMDSVVEPRRCAQTPYSTGLWGLVIGKPQARSDCAVAEL